ncbi:hypothetical protein GCM10010840_30450 [Deinococcus aerolatus]|uniref:Uncharacterized protein n=1 Tax=Deinococcus aerolatus TaxID=522487 RepID=A0ABQ2GDU7_9DEIO|nr:hypothetical protein [Deinococcus aerolatus]GGL90298.1 hypothetical protein GCM10010840_30450 [Deinococcus aerolatus]
MPREADALSAVLPGAARGCGVIPETDVRRVVGMLAAEARMFRAGRRGGRGLEPE